MNDVLYMSRVHRVTYIREKPNAILYYTYKFYQTRPIRSSSIQYPISSGKLRSLRATYIGTNFICIYIKTCIYVSSGLPNSQRTLKVYTSNDIARFSHKLQDIFWFLFCSLDWAIAPPRSWNLPSIYSI